MKRTKFIAGALVLSMGLLGTGYAYWTDALSINATVSTGELDVYYTKTAEPTFKNTQGTEANKYGSVNSIVSEDKNQIGITINNLHPGTTAIVPFNLVNESTIGIKPVIDVVVTARDATGSNIVLPVDAINVQLKEGSSTTGSLPNQSLKEALEYVFNERMVDGLCGEDGILEPERKSANMILTFSGATNGGVDSENNSIPSNLPQGATISVTVKTDWKQHNAN